jgi:thioredoxin-related protein
MLFLRILHDITIMKKIFFIAILLVSFSINAQEINWVTLEDAVELQKTNPKKIMIDMYTVWCGPCKMLDKNTFHNKDVVDYINTYYYAVKFNAEGNDELTFSGKSFSNPNYKPEMAKRRNSPHQLTRYFKVTAYPSMVFIDEDLKHLTTLRGYQNPQQLELYLKLFKEDKHKAMDSQEKFNEYYKAFIPAFKD